MHDRRSWLAAFAAAMGAFGLSTAEAAPRASQVRVCVEVVPKTWTVGDPHDVAPAATPAPSVQPAQPAQSPQAAVPQATRAPAPPQRRVEQRFHPELHLKRLLEYEVTHDESYDAVADGCSERITVELYEIQDGWTVFGRFSRYAREEKVDHVRLDEFAALAERMARALLWDRPIEATLTRKNVLRDDSEAQTRRIQGSSFASFGLGTSARVGKLPTAGDDPSAPATDSLRLLTPFAISAGLRQEMGAWGLEGSGTLDFGTTERAANRNLAGGHADYSWGAGGTLHFFRYADPAGMNSLYFGGGATFRLQRFTLIRPAAERTGDSRDPAWTGGLDLDLVAGYEFLRANAVHFYTQVELDVPTYVVQVETDSSRIGSYLPGAAARIGVLF